MKARSLVRPDTMDAAEQHIKELIRTGNPRKPDNMPLADYEQFREAVSNIEYLIRYKSQLADALALEIMAMRKKEQP